MPRKIPSQSGLALMLLHASQGWTAKELAAAAGISPSTLSAYMTGDLLLPRERLEWLAAKMGIKPEKVDRALSAAGLVHTEPAAPVSPVDPTAEEWQIIETAVAMGSREVADLLRSFLCSEIRAEYVRQAHEEADALFKRLKTYSPADRRTLVQGGPDFHTWALCVRLCDESEKSAAHSAQHAREWGELACEVARQVSGTESWRSRLLGYAEGFFANALRVSNKVGTAAAAFVRTWQFWNAGSDEAGLLDEGRLLDLEASLRCAQRQFSEALKLHDRALEVARPDQIGVILLNKSATLEEKGEYDASIEVLQRAAGVIDGQRQPRLLFGVRFNLASNLCRLGRVLEAVPIEREVQKLAEQLRNDLDLVRTQWLGGNLSAALGQHEEAIATLEKVRGDFEDRKLPYDHALASLDLALLYREQGRLIEVQDLAAEMLKLFSAEGVHREAVAAVILFHDAAQRAEVTVDLVARVQDYLKGARQNSDLRFMG